DVEAVDTRRRSVVEGDVSSLGSAGETPPRDGPPRDGSLKGAPSGVLPRRGLGDSAVAGLSAPSPGARALAQRFGITLTVAEHLVRLGYAGSDEGAPSTERFLEPRLRDLTAPDG